MRHVLFLTLRQLSFVWRLLPLPPSRHYLWHRAQTEHKLSSKPAVVFSARFLIQSWGRWRLNTPLLNTTPWQPKSYIWGFDRRLVELKRRDSLKLLHSGGITLHNKVQRGQLNSTIELSQFVPYVEFSAWGGKTALRQWYWVKCYHSSVKGASNLSPLANSSKRSEDSLFMQLFCDKIFNGSAQFYSKGTLGVLMPNLPDAAAARLSGAFWANFLSQLSSSSLDQSCPTQEVFMDLGKILAEHKHPGLAYPLKDSLHTCGIFAAANLRFAAGHDIVTFYTLGVKSAHAFNSFHALLWWVVCWHLLVNEAYLTCCTVMGVKNRPMQKQNWASRDKKWVYRPKHLHRCVETRWTNIVFKYRRSRDLGLEKHTLLAQAGIFLRSGLNYLSARSRKYSWLFKKLYTLLALPHRWCTALTQKGGKAYIGQFHYTAHLPRVREQWAPFLKSRWYPKIVHNCSFISWHHIGVLIAKRCWLELALRLLRLRYRWGSLEYKRRFDALNPFTTKAGIELLEHTPLAKMPFLWRMVWHLILRWEYWPASKRYAHTYKPEIEPASSLSERIRDQDYDLTKWETLAINQYSAGRLKVTGLNYLSLLYKYLIANFLFYFRLLGIRVFDFIFWIIDKVLLAYSILVLHLIWICVSFFYESRGLYREYEKKLIKGQALTFKIRSFVYGMRIFLRVLYLFKAINTFLVCTCYFVCADIRWWPWWAAASSKTFWWTKVAQSVVIFYLWLWGLAFKLIFFPIKLVYVFATVVIQSFRRILSYVSKILKVAWVFFLKKKNKKKMIFYALSPSLN